MKLHEKRWEASPVGDPDVTPRIWEEGTGRLVAHVATDEEARELAAAPAMARALLATRRPDLKDPCWCHYARDTAAFGHAVGCLEALATLKDAGELE